MFLYELQQKSLKILNGILITQIFVDKLSSKLISVHHTFQTCSPLRLTTNFLIRCSIRNQINDKSRTKFK